jgi:hypothetical protein
MKFLIKFPTRGRHDKFFRMLDLYRDKLSGKHEVEFLISCDTSDPTMNNNETIDRLSSYDNLAYYFGERKNKVFAINRDMEKSNGWDILLLASDDMTPVVDSYDDIIVEAFMKYYPDGDGVLHYPDGLNNKLNTIPIMGRKYYERFNYIYNPVYYTWYCDDELMQVAQLLGRHTFINKIIIRHDHVHSGRSPKDQLWRENESGAWKRHDGAIFRDRRSKRFGLKV